MIRLFSKPYDRILNTVRRRDRHDFEFSLFSWGGMLGVLALGIVAQVVFATDPAPGLLVRTVLGLALAALCYRLIQQWISLPAGLALALAVVALGVEQFSFSTHLAWHPGPGDLFTLGGLVLACLTGPSLQVITQWDKVVVLRLGKFHKVHGPGPFLLVPLLDRCAAFVDTRIRVTDFSAEKILTRDTVPVHIDALAFWMIWDAKKAILEVEDFIEAVTLSAQTALRDSIGKYSLSTILSERETLYAEIQRILDDKTNPWGISILSVEFVDIELPAELQDAMSKQAQAEREKEARLLLAQAEQAVAETYCQAAKVYHNNPEAMNLRAMNMVYDSLKIHGGLVLLPSGILESMNIGSVVALAKQTAPTADGAAETTNLKV